MSTINSVQELVDHAADLHRLSKHRWLFRGQRAAEWGLLPSIYRLYGSEEETYLTQEFRARAGTRHSNLPRYEDYADWLALMQHYGLPTRLLDWTHSALTAAFFAVEHTLRHWESRDACPADAAIWALCPSVLNETQGLKPYMYPLNSGDLYNLVTGAFFSVADTSLVVAAAMAVEKDARMQVQRGAFTIHGSSIPLEQTKDSDQWLKKFIIPCGSVERLGVQVEQLGVGLADLFPDLGSLARDLSSRLRPTRRP